MEGKELFFKIFTQINEYYLSEYRRINYPGAQSSEILKIHTSIRCHQTAGHLTLRHLSLEELLQYPGQHPTGLEGQQSRSPLLVPVKPQLLSLTTEGQPAASHLGSCTTLANTVLTKLCLLV